MPSPDIDTILKTLDEAETLLELLKLVIAVLLSVCVILTGTIILLSRHIVKMYDARIETDSINASTLEKFLVTLEGFKGTVDSLNNTVNDIYKETLKGR